MSWVGCQSRLLPGSRGQIKGQAFSNVCLCLSDSLGFFNFETSFTLGPECFIILCSSKAAQTTLKVNLFRAVIIGRMIKLHFSTLLSIAEFQIIFIDVVMT